MKLILKCKMQKTDLVTSRVDEINADFHSEIEKNLDGTNENELYEEMIETIRENISIKGEVIGGL